MNKEELKIAVRDLEISLSRLKGLVADCDEKEEKLKVEPTKKISLEEVRVVLAKLSQHGKTSDVKALITKYGASKLSEVDESMYEALLDDAKEIKIE